MNPINVWKKLPGVAGTGGSPRGFVTWDRRSLPHLYLNVRPGFRAVGHSEVYDSMKDLNSSSLTCLSRDASAG